MISYDTSYIKGYCVWPINWAPAAVWFYDVICKAVEKIVLMEGWKGLLKNLVKIENNFSAEVLWCKSVLITVVAPVTEIPRPQNKRKEVWRAKRIKPSVKYIIILYIVYCQVILSIYATQLLSRRNYGPESTYKKVILARSSERALFVNHVRCILAP